MRNWLARIFTKKEQVYLSSTFSDMVEYRRTVKSALENSGFEIEHMERYAAFDDRPLEKCLLDVRACDYYVLILGRRYGYVPNECNPLRLSITHLEYREALRAQKRILAFLLNSSVAWEGKHTDTNHETPESNIGRFREEVMVRHGVSFFDSPADLAQKVLQAMSSTMARSRNRRRLNTIITLGAVSFGTGLLAYREVSVDPSVTAADWLQAVTAAQERTLAEVQSGETPARMRSARRNVEYLSRIASDASAWRRFQDAFGAADKILARLYPGYGRGSLRRDLSSGNIAKIVEALTRMSTRSVGDAAERHFLIGAFLEIDGRLEEAFGAFERAALAEPLNSRYSTAALELATNTGQIKEAIALAEAQRRALTRQLVQPDDLASVMGYEALARWFSGDSEISKSLFEGAINLAKNNSTRARLFNDRVPIFNEAGDLLGAERTLSEAVWLYGCSDSDHQLGLISSLLNLTGALIRQGRTADAEEYLLYIDKQFQGEPYTNSPFPIYRAQRDVATGLLELVKGNAASSQISLQNALIKFTAMGLQSSFLATRARQYLGRANLLGNNVTQAISDLLDAVQQNRRLFTDDHVETATTRVYLAEAYMAASQFRAASRELAAVSDLMNKSPKRAWRFIGKYEMLSSLLTLDDSTGFDHAKVAQDREAALRALENGCRNLSSQGSVSREAIECWNRAAALSGQDPQHIEKIANNILIIKTVLEDGSRKKPNFVGAWSRKCPP